MLTFQNKRIIFQFKRLKKIKKFIIKLKEKKEYTQKQVWQKNNKMAFNINIK